MNETLTGMGQRIFSLRKKKGLTQEGLANLAGVSYQTISTAELGKKALRPENIVKLSQALGVSTDYLLTGKHNLIDQSVLNGKLSEADPKKYDRIMRVIEIMLEDN